ncbi:MAG: hypothetical protein IPO58_09145 [Betaproteobacteria bacterium]|nr:hypothetical protein [Betaproteobacteria bacterium]MBK9606554.1 hypothetical protein [Betaproteobacteria bacterium]
MSEETFDYIIVGAGMPVIPSANLNASALMIGEKPADMVAGGRIDPKDK